MPIRRFLLILCVAVLPAVASSQDQHSPNLVVIFCDDLGYGDLGCFGHPTIKTPNLDRMAAEGTKFTQFYVAASVCTPSRAALLTGRLPVRTGMAGNRRVLFPDSVGGIPESELLLPEFLKENGYATGMFGKWHLGHRSQYLPHNNGFDRYLGIPYSNDMDKLKGKANRTGDPFGTTDWHDFDVPLLSGSAGEEAEEVERPADQTTITKRYAEAAADFISEHAGNSPFFVYLPHSMPHIPLFRSDEFAGKSLRGTYGDVIEEIDWSVGHVLSAIREAGVEDNTLVMFTSDNGPWLVFDEHGGSAGLLREGKGTTWEGGMRVPCVAYWPGTVPAGRVEPGLMSSMDVMPTMAELVGKDLPDDRVYDGVPQVELLTGKGPSNRDAIFYYRNRELFAVRSGLWKAHYITQDAYGRGQKKKIKHDRPLLYHLEVDPSERHELGEKHPEVLSQIEELVQRHQDAMDMPPSQLDRKS